MVALAFQPVLRCGPAARAQDRVRGPDRHGESSGARARCLGAFRVFGTVSVPPTAWQSKKARTLLKILVARRGRSTTRELLMETLWPDDDPAKLANRLSVALATVRAVLDPDKPHAADHFITADKDAIRLDLDRSPSTSRIPRCAGIGSVRFRQGVRGESAPS